jgi:SAM-dependent methyltransferase
VRLVDRTVNHRQTMTMMTGTTAESLQFCHVGGGQTFEHTRVLWPALVAAWQLSEKEAEYIDVRQGTQCRSCGSNVRSIALARAIMNFRAFAGTLTTFVGDRGQQDLRVLEINEAGTLHNVLRLSRHQLASFPEVDMRSLPFPSAAFDLVVHSDTLEHVPDPQKGLEECRRILDDRGALAFTVPVVVGRLSRARAGLPPELSRPRGVQ